VYTVHAPNASAALPALASMIMEHGDEVGSRQGNRVKEVLYSSIELERPWQREILTPGRKASLPAQIAETVWVLSGRNDIEWLSHYLPRAAEFSDDGSTWRGGYGPRLRNGRGVDQLAHVISLLRADPSTRRAVMSIYDPLLDTVPGKDIPCNDFITFQCRHGELYMGVTIRSNDLIWGWSGINAFEWSALQEIVAWMVGVRPGPLVFSQASLHIYDRHWNKALQLADVNVEPELSLADSPRFGGLPFPNISSLDIWMREWFRIEEQIRLDGKWHDEAVAHFPDPMLKSWLRVLQYHWRGDISYLEPLAGTRLLHAALLSPEVTR
jgi:thymidylate synthase